MLNGILRSRNAFDNGDTYPSHTDDGMSTQISSKSIGGLPSPVFRATSSTILSATARTSSRICKNTRNTTLSQSALKPTSFLGSSMTKLSCIFCKFVSCIFSEFVPCIFSDFVRLSRSSASYDSNGFLFSSCDMNNVNKLRSMSRAISRPLSDTKSNFIDDRSPSPNTSLNSLAFLPSVALYQNPVLGLNAEIKR